MVTSATPPTIGRRRTRFARLLYDTLLSKFYDRIPDGMIKLKGQAVELLRLKPGDRVVSLCCGTGQEFPFLQSKIGRRGRILGVDWSSGMLERARRRVRNCGWDNVTLLKADVTSLPTGALKPEGYDAGICTLGLSCISEPEKAYCALKGAVTTGGRIVVGDTCSFAGAKAALNPFQTMVNAPFGSTWRSLAASRVFAETLRSDLEEFELTWHLGGCYYIAAGTKRA